MFDVQEDEVIISIPWRRWGPEAFREAQDRDVPILLAISGVWCHWCHVMDAGTYKDPTAIRRASTEVVPIRVETDRRPDINSRYNLGGWPTTAFLTPQGDLLSGGTYMPVEEFLAVLDEVTGYYRDQRADLDKKLQRRRARRARISELRRRVRGDVTPDITDSVVEATRKSYDPEHGGFGNAPKFLLPDTIELALGVGSDRRDEGLLDIARTTLTAMAEGGVYDHVEGGFFRYSTTADWTVPHYEKMLDGNARLLSTYLHAGQLFDDPLFHTTARGIQTFAEAKLLNSTTGGFGGSVDADEEYYHLRADARAEWRPPAVDTTLYTNWNAMMISAFLEAAACFDEPFLAELGLGALEAVWSRSFAPESGLAHYDDGAPHLPGLLTDMIWMGQALLAAQTYQGSGDYLARAETLMDIMRSRLYDPEVGGFYDIPFDREALGRLQERLKQLNENAVAADLALRLYRLTGNDEYNEVAVGTLEAMAPYYKAYRQHAADYALAAYRFVYPPLHLIIVGDPGAEASRRLRMVALSIYNPNRLVESVDPETAPLRLEQLGLPAEPAPALYVRRGVAISLPVMEPERVREVVRAVPA